MADSIIRQKFKICYQCFHGATEFCNCHGVVFNSISVIVIMVIVNIIVIVVDIILIIVNNNDNSKNSNGKIVENISDFNCEFAKWIYNTINQ